MNNIQYNTAVFFIVWLALGIMLGCKAEERNKELNDNTDYIQFDPGILMCWYIVTCPIAIIVAIIKHVFINKWQK